MASLLVVPGGDACAGPAPRLSVGRSLRPQLGELTGGLVPAPRRRAQAGRLRRARTRAVTARAWWR